MIDINTHKKEPIKEEVRAFATKMSVLEFRYSFISTNDCNILEIKNQQILEAT